MNRNILIAGAGSGIGQKALSLLSSQDTHIICASRSPEAIEAAPNVTAVSFAELEAGNVDLPEKLDGAVYFPGTINLKPFQSLKEEDFQNDLEVNFIGATRFLRAAFPSLKRADAASVILFSTVAVQTGMPFHSSIAAAKGAVEGLTRSLAAEWAPKIRVNAIAPSLTDTPLATRFLDSNQKVEAARERHPLKQVGDPADVAELVRYLLSDASKFITGQILKIDGGMSGVRTF